MKDASLSTSKITQAHKKNRAQVKSVITHLNRFHNKALKSQSKLNELLLDNIFSKLLLPLWVSILEIEFNILQYENYPLTKGFLNSTNLSSSTECDKWIALTDFFFKEQYLKNHKREITKTSIGDTNYHRYTTIVEIINNELKPFIELRNRIVHGQWAVALNTTGTARNQELTQHVWTLSKKDLMLLKIFVENLPELLKFLIISKKTFERDYDVFINRINLAKQDVDLRLRGLIKLLSKT
ncbi:MAG: hypothetical protein D4R82_04730 [Dehalococcoidia bacterium]|jgi:hypothetical protein|nr:MAG: hypothetical protein D4R82_04730 [Dehalococcoidia bacterium]